MKEQITALGFVNGAIAAFAGIVPQLASFSLHALGLITGGVTALALFGAAYFKSAEDSAAGAIIFGITTLIGVVFLAVVAFTTWSGMHILGKVAIITILIAAAFAFFIELNEEFDDDFDGEAEMEAALRGD